MSTGSIRSVATSLVPDQQAGDRASAESAGVRKPPRSKEKSGSQEPASLPYYLRNRRHVRAVWNRGLDLDSSEVECSSSDSDSDVESNVSPRSSNAGRRPGHFAMVQKDDAPREAPAAGAPPSLSEVAEIVQTTASSIGRHPEIQAAVAQTAAAVKVPLALVRLENDAEDLARGIINPELRKALEQGENAGLFGNLELNPRARDNLFKRLALDFFNNNYKNPVAVGGASVANQWLRAWWTVTLTTTGRQLTYYALNALPELSKEHRVALAVMSVAPFSLALTTGGIMNYINGLATIWGSVGRGGLVAANLATAVGLAKMGKLTEAAPGLVAFSLQYCSMRDSTQLGIRAPNQMSGVELLPTAASGGFYTLWQMGVGAAMSYLAPGTSFRDAAVRGVINGMGETLDDLTLAMTHAFGDGAKKSQGSFVSKMAAGATSVMENTRVRLSLQIPTKREVMKTALGSLPGRAQLFSLITMWNVLLTQVIADLPPQQQKLISIFADAAMMGLVVYCLFGGVFDTKEPPARARGEEALLEEGNGSSVPLTQFGVSNSTADLLQPTTSQTSLEAPPSTIQWGTKGSGIWTSRPRVIPMEV